MTSIGWEPGMSIKDYDYARPSRRASSPIRPSRFWPGIVAIGSPLVVSAWAIAGAYAGIDVGWSIIVACIVPGLMPVIASTFGAGSPGRWSAVAVFSATIAAGLAAAAWDANRVMELDGAAFDPLVSGFAVWFTLFGSQALGCLLAAGIARAD